MGNQLDPLHKVAVDTPTCHAGGRHRRDELLRTIERAFPLLDVHVFRYWPFTNSLLLISVLSVGLFTVLFYIPLYLQQSQGLGAFEAGLLLLPQALIMAVCMPVAGRIYDRFGPRWPAVVGLSIVAWGTYELHVLTLETSHEHLIWLLTLRAFGMGIAMMPIMTGGIAAVPPALVSRASAFNNVVQRTSAALFVVRAPADAADDRTHFAHAELARGVHDCVRIRDGVAARGLDEQLRTRCDQLLFDLTLQSRQKCDGDEQHEHADTESEDESSS